MKINYRIWNNSHKDWNSPQTLTINNKNIEFKEVFDLIREDFANLIIQNLKENIDREDFVEKLKNNQSWKDYDLTNWDFDKTSISIDIGKKE